MNEILAESGKQEGWTMEEEKKEYTPAKSIEENQKDLINPEDFYDDKTNKKESKEKDDKVPELEAKNYRVESNEKWKIVKEKADIWDGEAYETKIVEVKVNPDWDIKEYVSWVPEQLIGEQVFSKIAMTNLALDGLLPWSKLPADKFAIQEMIDAQTWEDDTTKYNNFFNTYIKDKLPGYFDPAYGRFNNVDAWIDLRLADGSHAYFSKYGWNCRSTNPDYFCSIRLFKD